MSAGDYGAGEGPAGEDPLPAISPARNVRPPLALLFQGSVRDFPLEEDGSGLYQSTHPVDQQVQLALEVALGKTPAAPKVGLSVAAFPLGNADALQAEVERRVNAGRVGELVRAGDIRILELLGVQTGRSSVGIRLQYVNLRDPNGEARTINAST